MSVDTPPRPADDTPAPLDLDQFLGASERHDGGLPDNLLGWLTTTDHKAIGVAYAVTAMVFLGIGGALAGVMRAELTRPDLQLVDASTYNSLFTIHGSVMLFLFAAPFGFALANYLVPLQIGVPDMAFPRLNALSYWLYLFGGCVMLMGFLADGGAADFGWFAYPPLSGARGSAGLGGDLWIVAIILTGTSGTLTAVNVITTVTTMRAPGMTLFRMPILTWNLLLTSVMVVFAFPVLTGALTMLLADRRFGAQFYEPTEGGSPILYQHLFWFFGHPEVYIIALPFFGVVSEVIPVFARRPIFGYKGIVLATLAITGLSTSVWAHHMYATGLVALPFFAATTFLIAVPTGVKVFSWIGTMWGGSLSFPPPMLFALGFLGTFVMGGVTGVILASPTLDFHLTDSYFVVAHFHYVMGGTVVFALFAAIYFWWPKVTGRTLSPALGKVHFWLLLIGFHMTFFVMHVMGYQGLPRRVVDYPHNPDLERWNAIATAGYAIQAAAMVPFVIAIIRSLRSPPSARADPWNANSLEWATTSPPPHHNFEWLPPIRSERPTFDFRWINDPEVTASSLELAWRARRDHDDRWFPLQRWADEPDVESKAKIDPNEHDPPPEGAT